jgi:Polyketide cyclase / dehydrase and lipid transport
MDSAHVAVERTIDATPAAIYTVLADYDTHHPQIMPRSYFSNLEVEEGGLGSGTVFHITLKAPGTKQQLHMRVDEPQPGRVLTETNLDTGALTAFSVLPIDKGARAKVRISSIWDPASGVRGIVVDRLLTPMMMRRILEKQLEQLASYVRSDTYITA